MTGITNRQGIVAAAPNGPIIPDVVKFAARAVPEPAAGAVLVRCRIASVDPGNRSYLSVPTYRPQVMPGEVMLGYAIAEVVRSRHPGFEPGTSSRVGSAGRTTLRSPERRCSKSTAGRTWPIWSVFSERPG